MYMKVVLKLQICKQMLVIIAKEKESFLPLCIFNFYPYSQFVEHSSFFIQVIHLLFKISEISARDIFRC